MKDKKELIREAAVAVMAREGFYNSTTDKIAAEAGVSVGTIYNYFRSKDEILEYIFTVELEKRKKYYQELAKQELPVLERLRRLLQMHFSEVKQNPAVGRILVRERHSPDRSRLTAVADFIEGIPRFLAGVLDQAVSSGEIRQCNTQIVALALFGAVEGVVRSAVFEEDTAQQSRILELASEELMDLLCRGIV